MANSNERRDDQLDAGPNGAELNANFDPAPGRWATFARSAVHDVTLGWDERVGALGQSALIELRQLSDVFGGRKTWRQAGDEARRVSSDALTSMRRSREAGNRAYPFAASAGGLLPQVALAVLSGGLSVTPVAQGAMAASRSLAESPEDLTTFKGLKVAVPRAGAAGGTALALAKGAKLVQRVLAPIAECLLATKSFRPCLAQLRRITRGGKDLAWYRELGRKLLRD
jgi:hypothetical protein